MRSIVRKRAVWTVVTATAVTVALSGVASADAGLKVPNERAACIAQAWVPSNTDPDVPPGFLGGFISDFAHTGDWGHEIRQQGCKL